MRYLTLRVLTIFLAFTAFSSLQAKKIVYSDFTSTCMEFDGGSIKVETPELFHSLKAVYSQGEHVMIENGMVWKVDWWYQSTAKEWEEGDKLRVYHNEGVWEIENVSKGNSIWGQFWNYDINKLSTIKAIRDHNKIIELEDGKTFQTLNLSHVHQLGFQKGDLVFWMHTKGSSTHGYAILNLVRGSVMSYLKYQGVAQGNKDENPVDFNLNDVLELESRLSKQIKGQPEAINAVSDAILRFAAQINNPKKPIGVLLFVGPTGVGKTELCKVLAEDLLGSESKLLRFNMTDFTDRGSSTRLIGVPLGYYGCDEGGQLTEALKRHPNSIVLLDEMEKAAPEIHKIFLSVFDEGFIVDAKNERIDCTKCFFVMTSNLSGQTILNLSHNGYSSEEILEQIQSKLIKGLSPEFYNRVEPVIFHALSEECLQGLIDSMLKKVSETIYKQKQINLNIDPTVIEYLKENGYSRDLGARPLKGLIEKKVVGTISRAVIREQIPNGATLSLSFDASTNQWIVDWEEK